MTYQAYQWFVVQADLDPVGGHEQAGVRPVLVISADPLSRRYDVVSVVPLTSRKNNRPARLGEVLLPAGAGGLARESFALCYQVSTLDKSRLGRIYGEITDRGLRQQVADVLALCFDIPL